MLSLKRRTTSYRNGWPTTGRSRSRHFCTAGSQRIATESRSRRRSARRVDASICLEKCIDKRSDRRSLCEYNQTPQQDHDDDYWRQPELLPFAHEVPEVFHKLVHQITFLICCLSIIQTLVNIWICVPLDRVAVSGWSRLTTIMKF